MAKFVCNFISYVLKRTVDITVIIPSPTIPESMGLALDGTKPSHKKPEKYPVLYLLHGYGNNHAQWTGYTNVELFAEERNIAVVNLSAENKCYVKVGNDDFFTFVSEELPEFVTSNFPISTRPEDTYIAGLSMGGYGTFVHALSHPERYHAMGAFSAAVQLNPNNVAGAVEGEEQKLDPSVDPVALADQIASEGRKFPKIYMAVGGKDFLYQADKDYCAKLKSLGADVTWDEIPQYGHEWRFWNIEIERFLDWLPREDYYAKLGKRQI